MRRQLELRLWVGPFNQVQTSKYQVSKNEEHQCENGSRQNGEHEPVPKRRTRRGQSQHVRGKISLIGLVRSVSVLRSVRH